MSARSDPYVVEITNNVALAVLNVLVTALVAASVILCLDYVIDIVKYVLFKTRAWMTGKKSSMVDNNFNYVAMPDSATMGHKYPMVAVQLPMLNEREMCQAAIEHSCSIQWPRDRLMVQVLDDSTDKVACELVDHKVAEWQDKGVNVTCVRREIRKGCKAGSLTNGLKLLDEYEYIAIFDADFKPNTDFLMKMVPYIHSNDDVGYIQARWSFTNPNESMLTKVQQISMNYHFKCSQWVYFAGRGISMFNGSAGIWRKATIEDVGGWKSRTTVEDMDISLRTYLAGWQSMFIEDQVVPSELPSSYSAYRNQQHRWTCGPIHLWRWARSEISASKLSWYRKLELNFMDFLLRKTLRHFIALGFLCVVVPLSVFTEQVSIPQWASLYLPVFATLCAAAFTKSGWCYCVLHVLFENAMCVLKVRAVLAGFFDLGCAREWVVTQKLGSSDNGAASSLQVWRSWKANFYECTLGIFLLASAVFVLFCANRISLYLILQGTVFIGFGLGLVDAGAIFGLPLKSYRFWHRPGSDQKTKPRVKYD